MYFDYTSAEQTQRALDWFAIDNLFSAHCYCLRAGKRRYELDTYWADRKDIVYAEGPKSYSDRKSVYSVYADFEEELQQKKLKLLHEKYPEQIPLSEDALGAGDLDILCSGSTYIEVAKDGQTAKGVWYTLRLTAETDESGTPRAFLHSGRVAVDFIKEQHNWKIWHYRTSPDFSYEIPESQFLAGTTDACSIHPNPDCPAPNMKLRPLPENGLYNITRIPVFSPELSDGYDQWSVSSSFVAPEVQEDWIWNCDAGVAPALDNTEADAKYAANYVEVLNTASIHCYGYGSQQMYLELARFWAQRTEDLAGCHADRGHQGHDIQYKYYARGNMGMNWGKVELMHKLFPDKVALHPYNLGIGELVIRFYTSPYIVVAEDCKTAQGVWYSFGISSEVDKQARPVPFMQWGREMSDFVLEGDSWRLLHFRLSADIDYLLDSDIVRNKGLENGIPRVFGSVRPEYNCKLRPFLMDEIYSPFRVANYSPEPPFPFLTWDNRQSWALPDDPA